MSSPHPGDALVARADESVYETDEPVLYSVADGIATVTMNRPTFNNAQNSQMTYALDAAFERAVADGFLRPQNRAMALADSDIEGLLAAMAAYRAEPVSKWLKEEKQL